MTVTEEEAVNEIGRCPVSLLKPETVILDTNIILRNMLRSDP